MYYIRVRYIIRLLLVVFFVVDRHRDLLYGAVPSFVVVVVVVIRS